LQAVVKKKEKKRCFKERRPKTFIETSLAMIPIAVLSTLFALLAEERRKKKNAQAKQPERNTQ
jgi:hypothetical protein